jgi:hypothetical protein
MLHENDRMAQLKIKLAFRFFFNTDNMLFWPSVRQQLTTHGMKKPIWINLDVLW